MENMKTEKTTWNAHVTAIDEANRRLNKCKVKFMYSVYKRMFSHVLLVYYLHLHLMNNIMLTKLFHPSRWITNTCWLELLLVRTGRASIRTVKACLS